MLFLVGGSYREEARLIKIKSKGPFACGY